MWNTHSASLRCAAAFGIHPTGFAIRAVGPTRAGSVIQGLAIGTGSRLAITVSVGARNYCISRCQRLQPYWPIFLVTARTFCVEHTGFAIRVVGPTRAGSAMIGQGLPAVALNHNYCTGNGLINIVFSHTRNVVSCYGARMQLCKLTGSRRPNLPACFCTCLDAGVPVACRWAVGVVASCIPLEKMCCVHLHARTGQDRASQSKARQDQTRQGKARRDKTRQAKERQGKARRDHTRPDKTQHSTTQHNTPHRSHITLQVFWFQVLAGQGVLQSLFLLHLLASYCISRQCLR